MLKTAGLGLLPRMIACIGPQSSFSWANAPNAIGTAAAVTTRTTQKFLSQSQHRHKKFTINDHYEFDKKVINSENPVIVNFHADWCEPCEILTNKWIELLENSNEIDLVVIDVEKHTDLVETFEVKAVPAVLAFKNGVVVDKFIGLVDGNAIESMLEKLKKKHHPNELDG